MLYWKKEEILIQKYKDNLKLIEKKDYKIKNTLNLKYNPWLIKLIHLFLKNLWIQKLNIWIPFDFFNILEIKILLL
jgi:hypothetical protein